MDKYQKWYVGIVTDKKLDKDENVKIRVHFYHFPEKWDEWYGDDRLFNIAPLGKHKLAFKERIYLIPIFHKRIISNEEINKQESQNIGIPFMLTIGSWYTWEQLAIETMTQAARFIKFNESVSLSQRDHQILGNINENVSEEEDQGYDETKFRKIRKYDSSQFSNKMG